MQPNEIDNLRKDPAFLKLIKHLKKRGVFCLGQNSNIYIIYKAKTGEITLESVGEEGESIEKKKQRLKDDFKYSGDLNRITFPERIEKDAFSVSSSKRGIATVGIDKVYQITFRPHNIETELCRINSKGQLQSPDKFITVEELVDRFEEIEERIKQEALDKLNAKKRIKQTLAEGINLKSFLGEIEIVENGKVTILLNYNLEAFAKYLVDKNATSAPLQQEELITLEASEDTSVIKQQIKQLEEIQRQVQAINKVLNAIRLPNASSIEEIEETKQKIVQKAKERAENKNKPKPQPEVSSPEVQGELLAKPNPTILLDAGFFIKIDQRLGIPTLQQVLSFLKQEGFNLVITTEIKNELVSVRYDDIRGYLKRVPSKLTPQEKRIAKDLGEYSLLSLFEKQPQYSRVLFCTGDGNFVQKRIPEGLNNPIFIHPALLLIIAATNSGDLLKELIEEQKIPQGLRNLELKDPLLIEALNKLLVDDPKQTINLISIINQETLHLGKTIDKATMHLNAVKTNFDIISYRVHSPSTGRSI